MMLEGTNQSAAIGWVREDLDERLDSIRKNLEAFAEDPSHNGALTNVQNELERLHLTFQTMAQQGARILTDEMMAVGSHMLHNGNADCNDSLNALTDAVIRRQQGDLPVHEWALAELPEEAREAVRLTGARVSTLTMPFSIRTWKKSSGLGAGGLAC